MRENAHIPKVRLKNANKVRLIWNSIPSQIVRDNNQFIFSHVKQDARAKDLEDDLERIVHKLELVSILELPLPRMADNTYFKKRNT